MDKPKRWTYKEAMKRMNDISRARLPSFPDVASTTTTWEMFRANEPYIDYLEADNKEWQKKCRLWQESSFKNHSKSGIIGPTTIEPKEEIPEINTVAPQTAKTASAAIQLIAKNIPSPVAEDLPPLKPI